LRKDKSKVIAALLLAPFVASFLLTVPWSSVGNPPTPEQWILEPECVDYAPSGVPDFDQRQNASWKSPSGPHAGNWSWGGPLAVANGLWWLDSWFEANGVAPPTYSDSFPLVQNYGPWDDHSPSNVQPLAGELAALMGTDIHTFGNLTRGNVTIPVTSGTYIYEMARGVDEYLTMRGVNATLYTRTWVCNVTFEYLVQRVEMREVTILLLGFYEWQEVRTGEWAWARVGGQYVTVAGVGWDNSSNPWIMLSDPLVNHAETLGYGPPFVPAPHACTPTIHNNATYVSHDPYMVRSMGLGCGWGFEYDYPALQAIQGGGLSANGPVESWYNGSSGLVWTAAEAAVFICLNSSMRPEHDIGVSRVQAPAFTLSGAPATINATVYNAGGNNESSVEVRLLLNGTTVDFTTISQLSSAENRVVNFSWTAPGTPGIYNLTLYAPPVPGENLTSNNRAYRWAAVTAAVTVLPYGATAVYSDDVACRWRINISTFIENGGNENETFTATAYYDNNTIEAKNVELAPAANATLTFTWNLTGVAPCRYNYTGEYYLPYAITVNVSSPTLGETTRDAGAMTVRLPGDAGGDGRATGSDLAILGRAWYGIYPAAGYDWRADWSGDGRVTGSDLAILGRNWYKQAPAA